MKKDNERLEAERVKLTTEVNDLKVARVEAKSLKKETQDLLKEAEVLRKQAMDAKSAETLAVECALKANETSKGLRKELDAEKASGLALHQQVNLLSQRLKDAEGLALSVAKAYATALEQAAAPPPCQRSLLLSTFCLG